MTATVTKGSGRPVINALSVDVEDFFHVHALERYYPRSGWAGVKSRLAASLDRTLELFDRHRAKGTFFVLGWVAERFPAHVRRIVAEGHEVASHGFSHHRVTELTPDSFREDLRQTQQVLEGITGVAVRGYRAPSYSIGESTWWALEVLEEEGYAYSSSVYPFQHDHYGVPTAPRHPFRPASAGRLLEVPITTFTWAGRRFPCGGGGYFRLYPYAVSRWAIRRVNTQEGRPAVFYFHPWELDPAQPRVAAAPARTRIRHYLNLARMEARVDRLLEDFQWGRMDEVFLDASRPVTAEAA